MGIDCCFVIELFRDGKWKLVEWSEDTCRYEAVQIIKPEQLPGETDEEFEERGDGHLNRIPIISLQRHSGLFMLLGGIWSKNIIPISKMKGYPTDMSDATRNIAFLSGFDENSTTYFSIEELKNVVDHDILRPNSLFNKEYVKGQRGLSDFVDIIERTNINRGDQQARAVMWFG